MQFTMVPMNLCLPGKPVDVLHTGMWTAKAIGELKKGVLHTWDGEVGRVVDRAGWDAQR